MKKAFKLFVFLLILIPMKVNALTGNVNLNCNPKTAPGGTKIICNITATSDEGVSGFSANINLSNNLEFDSFVTDSIWEGNGENGKIGLYTDQNKEGNFNIGVLTIKVKDNTSNSNETISLSNCTYSDSNFTKVSLSNASANIRVPSTGNNLSSLTVSPGNINFDPNTTNYSFEVESNTININATKEDANSTLSGDIGTKNLNYGINTFNIVVTSEAGVVKNYTLNVTRKDNRSSENALSKLTIDGYNINFNSSKGEYSLTVENSVTSININSILKDSKSSYVQGYEPGRKSLNVGLNKFEIRVQAENGSIRTYKVNVTRKDVEKSNDNYLTDIELDTVKINFDKETEEYKISVPYDTESIDIGAKLSSDKAKVEILGNENLKVGENEVIVKVTAENGSVREYKIIVTRKEEDIPLSNNSYLKSLDIENYNLNFNKSLYNYTLTINDEEKLSIEAISEDEKASVVVKGNNNLKDGSIIEIIVTAEDSTTSTYKININKENKINYLLIVIIIETIAILGFVVYLVIKNIRKRKEESYEEF